MAPSRTMAAVLLLVVLAAVASSASELHDFTPATNLAAEMQARATSVNANRKLAGYRPIPIDSSIVLLFMEDVEGGDNSPCVRMVQRALEFKGRAINFFMTAYYADYNGDNKVDRLGYKQSQWDKSFRELNPNAAYRFARGLTHCMRKAVDANMLIVTHIHLDDGLDKGSWRNVIDFSPTQKYGSVTFWEVVGKPTAQAVKDANYRKREVYYAMQAEMGATLFYHPAAWRSLIPEVKKVISGSGTPRSKIKVGVNINWEKICGCPAELIYAVNYYSDVQNSWWKVRQTVNIPEVQRMFRAVDFIGVSAYAGLPRYPNINDLETSLKKVDQEMKLFGMDLRGLGKEIIYSEYGLGGGQTGDYKTPAESAFNVASAPYWGVEGVYTPSLDPWRVADNRQYMQQYYQLTTEYARRGGIQYPVSAIFLWNIISYDIQGIHYFSSNNQGSYRDDSVSALIKRHNQGVRGW